MLAKLGISHIVNTAAVRFIESQPIGPKGEERQKITFTDSSTLVVLCSDEQAERVTGQVIPAPAGYAVIEAYPPNEGETEPAFRTLPVIAFRTMTADQSVSLMPITPAGEPENTWALVYPDGRCDVQWDRIHDSVDAFKAECRQQLAHR